MIIKFFVFFLLFLTSLYSMPIESYIKPYFSKTSGAYYKGGVDTLIVQDIRKSSQTIKMAMYYLTNKNITNALIQAKKRGVSVEVITDDKKEHTQKYEKLREAGIVIHNDANPKSLMHNKILILDKKIVWIGSGNYTVYAFYRNYDNFLKIEDSKVANYYTKKFQKIFSHNQGVMEPFISKEIEIYFSPDTNFEKRIIELISKAKKSLYFLAFAYTNHKIADAMIEAKKRGVKVQGVFDKAQNKYQRYSQYKYLKEHGVDVVLDKSKFKLHNKVMIIDEKIVITGSYNFTKKANSTNDENSIVLHSKAISQKYLNNFYTIFKVK